MATQIVSASLPPSMADKLRTEATESGLKVSTIIQQALSARWEAQDA